MVGILQILLLQILQMCYLEFLHFLKSSYSFKPRSFTQIYFVDYGKIKFEPPSVSLYYKNLSEIQNFIQTCFVLHSHDCWCCLCLCHDLSHCHSQPCTCSEHAQHPASSYLFIVYDNWLCQELKEWYSPFICTYICLVQNCIELQIIIFFQSWVYFRSF